MENNEKIQDENDILSKLSNRKGIISKILLIIVLLPSIYFGGFMAFCGGVSIISWDGYSIGLFGILFLIPGLLLYNHSIDIFIKVFIKNQKYVNITKILFYIPLLFLFLITLYDVIQKGKLF